ncbi:MAG: hypothetical protein Q4P33_03850 [Flaviflexus sp.]|nr:hypothetical protein [Flaviflexus sp.]
MEKNPDGLPTTDKELIALQKKRAIIAVLLGLALMILAFYAGKTVRSWMSEDKPDQARATASIVLALGEERA